MHGEKSIVNYRSPIITRKVCEPVREELHNGSLKSRKEQFDRLLAFLIRPEETDARSKIQFLVISIRHPHVL